MNGPVSKETRDILQLALGSPIEADPDFALGILLEIAHADASNLTDAPDTLDISHCNRLKVLRKFVDKYMLVSWRETEEDRAAAAGGRAL